MKIQFYLKMKINSLENDHCFVPFIEFQNENENIKRNIYIYNFES